MPDIHLCKLVNRRATRRFCPIYSFATLTAWARACPRPTVLFVDEADSLFDDLFLALLRQLRAGFDLVG